MSENFKAEPIGEVIESALLHAGEPTVAPEVSRVGDKYVVAIRDGYELKELQVRRATVRRHQFYDVGSFADFLSRNYYGEVQDVLLDPTSQLITCNHVSCAHEHDAVSCKLTVHPRFARWIRVLCAPMDTKTFARHLRATVDDFGLVIANDGMVMGTQADELIRQVSKVTGTRGITFESELGPNGTYVVQGATDKATVSGSLPSSIRVTVPAYLGVDAPSNHGVTWAPAVYTLNIELEVEVDPTKGVLIHLSCPAMDEVKHEAAMDARRYLAFLLGEAWQVGVGSAAYLEHVPREITVSRLSPREAWARSDIGAPPPVPPIPGETITHGEAANPDAATGTGGSGPDPIDPSSLIPD